MVDDTLKPKLEIVPDLDDDEREFRAMRRDLPGVKGSSAVGIVSIGVSKLPGSVKNEFFRTHPEFAMVTALHPAEVGMENYYFACTDEMVQALDVIGVSVSDHSLYLTVSQRGSVKIVPVRCANKEGDQNEYARTKEIGLAQGKEGWVRLYTDQENKCYKVFHAPEGRFSDPQWPELKPAKIFRLAFRDKGRLIDSPQHPLFQKLAARDKDK
jgi:hypothetical protein